MPPDLAPIPLPTDLGESAYRYLQHHGINAIVPTIRSSDYGLCRRSPRLYYIIRRLGLIKALRWAEALNRGSWFHTIFGLYKAPHRRSLYDKMLAARCKELLTTCRMIGYGVEATEDVIQREKLDALTALGWFDALEFIPIKFDSTGAHDTLREFLDHPRWGHLGGEVRIVRKWEATALVVQIDRLLYNRDTNTVHIVDPKTTTESCLQRLSTVRNEFQTKHYMITVDWAMQEGIIQKMFDLPSDAKFGSMMHIAIWKPGITYGQKDRPYHWYAEGKRKKVKGNLLHTREEGIWQAVACHFTQRLEIDGSVVGEGDFEEAFDALHKATGKKPDKVFVGEPDLARFTKRLRECYLAQGEYERFAERHAEDPPINVSFTGAANLKDSLWLTDYWDCVHYIHSHATCDPHPENFLPPDMRDVRGTEYLPFFTNDIMRWPEIIQENHFVTARRDADLEGKTESAISSLQE